jgi:hypothetical protein
MVYDSSGIQVGIISDLSTDDHAFPPVKNRHPSELTPQEIRSLLGSLEVSGWSGTVLGILLTPQARPVFTEAELVLLAEPLANGFRQATPYERVFFSIQNINKPYETDRTAGSLFFRDEFLHVILTDHYAFLKADPGGGETRDPRDTKGMKLWVALPALPATVPDEKEPHWNEFEKVHISLKPTDVLAKQTVASTPQDARRLETGASVAAPPLVKSNVAAPTATDQVNDLRLQIRELTSANQDLRLQLKEQTDTIEKLKADLEQLRSTLDTGSSKPDRKPSRR